MKKVTLIILWIFIAIVLSYAVAYIIALKSEEFKIARKFIYSNDEIKNICGEVNKIYLRPFDNIIKKRGVGDYTELVIKIKGNKSEALLKINFEKFSIKWEILNAELFLNNGEVLKLKNENH